MQRKSELLMDEGYEQDQAVAIAYKHCGETNLADKSSVEKTDLSINQIHTPSADQTSFDIKIAHDLLVDETSGSVDYQEAIARAQDADLKAILKEIAADETEHMKMLSDWIEAHKVEKALKSMTVEIAKVADNIVYGIVLRAGIPDLQGDVMSAEDIAKACHEFMSDYRTINVDHARDIDASPVECWLAKESGYLGESKYGPGDWLMGTRIDDPVVLQGVLDGRYKSYSIEGEGVRVPL